ncbi:MAG: methyltransferase domain-containing protein [Gemmatimonadales bacterium]|nr:methyltransferase domain-containing protein [Gemmatimonadales bacterium]NIN12050.1 methyltransferase domain-containing protein [Gemmatimonadales bacterium]NIR03285.1 methyltransferase domain-containing protein [Gemmatimonadales bacterium]NIS66965.1 methyltransferase domain-containing protein [Gemmatimonadales bacterium]
MNCCQCQGFEQVFSGKCVARELRQYRRKGPGKTTRMLLDALKGDHIRGKTLLDIGGGVGIIQHELLDAGVVRAHAVEASSAYLEVAEAEARKRGYGDRVQFSHGNFVDRAPELPDADIVTLDRVICCYHDMPTLVKLSAARARHLYGLVYPRDTWLTRASFRIMNFGLWLWRNPFRVFVHASDAVDEVVRRSGLERRFYRKTPMWQVVVYERSVAE